MVRLFVFLEHCRGSGDQGEKDYQLEKEENPLSSPCIPPNPGFHNLSSKSKFLAVGCQNRSHSRHLRLKISVLDPNLVTRIQLGSGLPPCGRGSSANSN